MVANKASTAMEETDELGGGGGGGDTDAGGVGEVEAVTLIANFWPRRQWLSMVQM